MNVQIDRYTKTVLTLIAVGLFLNAAVNLIPSAHAAVNYGSGEEVRVSNYETDMRPGEILYVYCKNCSK